MFRSEYRVLLDISDDTYKKDKEKIIKIWDITEKQLLVKLKTDEIPEKLDYIVPSIVVKRYNRLGFEGMEQHSQSEETISYNLDDFGEFQDEINDYLEEQGLIRKRKVSFL
ncbi:phage head-tail connector protein [Enterococcus faecalis]|uniref:phage head-tail connector protein n=1 Tax=Enterococcus faecalis TaxID=1351 RepID=UPI0006658DD9|nr:phage head-tail connector protein [Enterococcus faecalis]DAH28607.1 MAG TPA: tail connector protein [Caudoviricetes sp.]EGO2799404.1 phage head-tail connector protein [Enterococcus faecalis]EGO8065810.1 phage head-tail connector protein [Enterococcus faecalis]EJB2751345.1 phage head-tail connector protein [Enterococcus faecalis]MCU9781310.1 phage head-tail connector protein [Enterococcus faecalis]